MSSLTLIMENEFRPKRMSHYVINHAQGRAHSDHLWHFIKQGAKKTHLCQFACIGSMNMSQTCSKDKKTPVFLKGGNEERYEMAVGQEATVSKSLPFSLRKQDDGPEKASPE